MTVEQRMDRIANTTQDLIESQRHSYEAMADSFITFQKRNVRFLQSGADLAKLQEENLRAVSDFQNFWKDGSRMVELQQRNVRFFQSWMTSGVDYLRNQAEDNQRAAEAFARSARDQQEGLRKLGEDYFGLAEEVASTSRSYAEEGMKNAQHMTERLAEQATQVGEQATQQGLRLAEEATEEATEQVEDAEKQADPNSLPIENYDKLNVSEVSGKLDGLSADELEKVRNYEKHNKNRETLIGEINLKLANAS